MHYLQHHPAHSVLATKTETLRSGTERARAVLVKEATALARVAMAAHVRVASVIAAAAAVVSNVRRTARG